MHQNIGWTRRSILLGIGAALTLLTASHGVARPYATSLTNSGTALSFRLNEAADNVRVISSGGSVTNDLGARPKGLNVVNVTVTGVYRLQVTKNTGPGWMQGVANQISEDTNQFVKFTNQRGLAINRNTNSPYFGRIYVSIGSSGTVTSNEFNLGTRAVADGIYVLNADQTDALGQGNTPRTGGLKFDFTSANAESPGYLAIGADDHLYISDWSDANGGVWVTDGDVATNSIATNVLGGIGGPSTVTGNHGSVSGVYVEGSQAAGNLAVYTADEDVAPKNAILRYDIGSAELPYELPGTQVLTFGLASQRSKITRGPDGKWYCTNRRADNASTTGLFVVDSDGTTLWSSLSQWRTFIGNATAYDSIFSETRGMDVSPDGKYVMTFKALTNLTAAPYNLGPNSLVILPLQEGLPNLGGMQLVRTTPATGTGWDAAFDAVGNIYTLSTGQGLRVYSPGGLSVVTTGSDGSLETFVPNLPGVSVAVTDAEAAEEASAPGEFSLSRDTVDLSQPLIVKFQMSGSATLGADYVLQTNGVTLTTNVVTIPVGETSVLVALVPIDDSLAEFTEAATLTVVSGPDYTVASAGASVNILDNEAPSLNIMVAQAQMFEANLNDYAALRLIRLGSIANNGQDVSVNLTYSGDAVSGADFTGLPSVTLPTGAVTYDFRIYPLNDALLETNETFRIGLAAGAGYSVGATNLSGPITIVDDETPPAPVLFADDLNGDSSLNWTLRFGSGNDIDDYRINEIPMYFMPIPWDYSTESYPPAPNGADTLGLKVSVNKDDVTAAGAAGINLYRNGVTFSGNYALRFDMYLIVNNLAGTTENAIFGINHSGDATNWFRASNNGFTNSAYDGVWCIVGADGAALGQFNGGAGSGDYEIVGGASPVQVGGIWGPPTLASRNATAFTSAFKTPPWGSAAVTGAGVPSNVQGTTTASWAQVELGQVGNLIHLKINNTLILTATNNTPSTSGKIMLGYDDAYDSNTGTGGAVIYDNVRVVQLGQPQITGVSRAGDTMTIDFTWSLNDPVTLFAVVKADTVTGAYTPVTAGIVPTSPGSYRATITGQNTAGAFYRIRR